MFDSDDDFLFGVDLSALDVAEIVEETDCSTSTSDTTESSCQASPSFSSHVDKLLTIGLPGVAMPADDKDFDDLFAWATNRGAQLDGLRCGKDAHGGRGLLSTRSFKQGDIVAVLPRELRIGQNTACKTLRLPSGTPDLSALALFLLAITFDKGDNFQHYAMSLPKMGSNAVFMSEHQIRAYRACGENYAKAILAVQNQAASCEEYIRDMLASDDFTTPTNTGLKWAISIVQSRTHGFGTNRSRWLTPCFDLANHSVTPSCNLEGDAEGRLVLRAVKDIETGEEITIDYQVPDDAKLVATYGFSLEHPLISAFDEQ